MRIDRFVLDANIWVSYVNIPAALSLIKGTTTHFDIPYPIKRYIPTDKDDDYLIALALQTSSGFITAGDKNIISEKVNLWDSVSLI